MVLKALWLVILLGIVPLIIGLPWIKTINPKHKYAFAYSTGFFMVLALFQTVSVPVIIFQGSFTTIVIAYSITLLLCVCFSIWQTCKNDLLVKLTIRKIHWSEWFYLAGFVFVLGVQIVRAFTYDITYMSYDDATYSVYASDAYVGNGVLSIDAYTGTRTILTTKRTLSSWNILPSFIAIASGVSVVVITHTVQYIQLIILAYSTYWFLAGEIISKRDNQLIFMLIIALLYWFGYHSHYSLTFRLLGPNYQGKAVLAVSFTPLIMAVLLKQMEKAYSLRTGLYIFVLSLGGVALTLWSTGTIFILVFVPLLLSLFRKERRWKHMLYAVWGCIIPALVFGYFLINKYAV